MHVSESDLDNILVSQKNDIIKDLNDSEYERALNKLHVLRHLWKQTAYTYKWREMCERAANQLETERKDVQEKYLPIFRRYLDAIGK